jgi:gluconate 5-dehydrogenase
MSGWLGLEDSRALVVGAGGFGGACATALAEQGAQVYVADRDAQRFAPLRRDRVVGAVWDVTERGACEALVADAADRLGGLDVLVHAVGINDRRPVLELDVDRWREILDVNLTSAFELGRAAGTRFTEREGGGRIVYFSSVSGLLAHPHHAPYAASKGGMNQLLKVMAIEWADRGITVNAVAPGYTESALTEAHLDEPGVREQLTSKVPAGRLGTLEDVVGPVLFLCSPRSSFVTGQVLYVDGGRILD